MLRPALKPDTVSYTLDVITYSALLSACGKSATPKGALQLLEAMLHQDVRQKVTTRSALLSACAKGELQQRTVSSWRPWRTKASCQTESPTTPWPRLREGARQPRTFELLETI